MFCPNCGKEIADGVKFCAECGTKAQNNNNEQPQPSFSGNKTVPYEVIQATKEEPLVAAARKVGGSLAAFGVVYALVSFFISGMSGLDLRIIAFFVIGAIACFALSKFANKNPAVTDHYKFVCPRCGEENKISADTETGFSCKKCEKKFVIANQEILDID